MGPLVIPAIIAGTKIATDLLGAKMQASHNMRLARFQHSANQELLAQQLEYDKPINQMARFQEAGLNPHLIYGQGNPGNQSTPLSYPDIGRADVQSVFSNIIPTINQSLLAQSQVQATDAKTRHTYALTQLAELQRLVMEKNPLLNEEGFKATIESLKSSAEIKASESKLRKNEVFVSDATMTNQALKIQKEVELLEQRFNLGKLDSAVKAEVIKSKEFQNAMLEVQKRFMADGDIGPSQILQFIQILLMKLL